MQARKPLEFVLPPAAEQLPEWGVYGKCEVGSIGTIFVMKSPCSTVSWRGWLPFILKCL